MSQYSIIITSHNRPKTLIRTLKFLIMCDSNANIIIADSSKNILSDMELKKFIVLNGIKLKIFPEDIRVAEKISLTVESSKTMYSVLCADDDFIYPDSIKKCINFLEHNPGYIACHGKYYSHTNGDITKKKGLVLRKLTKKLISADEESSDDRVKKYIAGKIEQQYTFYAVMKTSDLAEVWRETSKYANEWFFLEYYSTLISLMKGKMKTLPIFYMSREPNSYDWTDNVKVKKIFNTPNNLEVSKNLVNYAAKHKKIINLEKEINFFFNFFENSRENYLKFNNKNTDKALVSNNVSYLIKLKIITALIVSFLLSKNIKTLLRFLIYPIQKILFSFTKELPSIHVKKLEELISMYSSEIQKEISDTRKKY